MTNLCKLLVVPCALCAVMAFATPARAGVFTVTDSVSALEWDPSPIGNQLDDLTLSITGLDPAAASDLSITFKLRGDFDLSSEYVEIDVDGFSFGRWLNNVVGDDTIDGPVGDNGGPFSNQSAMIWVGTATIAQADLLPLIADGQLDANFVFSSAVNDLADPPFNSFEDPEFAEFSISYEAVPEPTSLAIFGLGAIGMAGMRRRRKQKKTA